MNLSGLQKLTLLDFPGRMACTVFIDGCNFRCPFCHNSGLVIDHTAPALEQEAFFSFLKKRAGVLDGVCVTGGEPLLHTDLGPFLERIKSLGYQVKLDTNGSFPDRLAALAEAGWIDYVAMDIKNSKEQYARTAGLPELSMDPICRSVEFLLSGKVDYEFRTTVVREFHSRREFEQIAQWLQGARRYFLQAFVDSPQVIQSGLHGCAKEKMEEFCGLLRSRGIPAELRGVE